MAPWQEVKLLTWARLPTSSKGEHKAVSKNKPKKVLKYNYCASKMGAHGFSGKKLGPTWGAVYRKWKIKNHCQDSKVDQRSVKNSKKGYKRNIQITNNQNHPQYNLYWGWKKMVSIHYFKVLDEICVLNAKTVITRKLLQAYYKDSC